MRYEEVPKGPGRPPGSGKKQEKLVSDPQQQSQEGDGGSSPDKKPAKRKYKKRAPKQLGQSGSNSLLLPGLQVGKIEFPFPFYWNEKAFLLRPPPQTRPHYFTAQQAYPPLLLRSLFWLHIFKLPHLCCFKKTRRLQKEA